MYTQFMYLHLYLLRYPISIDAITLSGMLLLRQYSEQKGTTYAADGWTDGC